MDDWIKDPRHGQNIAYADDSISFSDFEIDVKPLRESKITINEEKSKYVKKAGVWLHPPLKFVGLVYDGNKYEFRADTRKGSKLVFGE